MQSCCRVGIHRFMTGEHGDTVVNPTSTAPDVLRSPFAASKDARRAAGAGWACRA